MVARRVSVYVPPPLQNMNVKTCLSLQCMFMVDTRPNNPHRPHTLKPYNTHTHTDTTKLDILDCFTYLAADTTSVTMVTIGQPPTERNKIHERKPFERLKLLSSLVNDLLCRQLEYRNNNNWCAHQCS